MIKASTLDTIGGTPIVRLNQVVPPGSADVLVKLEYFNPTGSYKDRMAKAMIEYAERHAQAGHDGRRVHGRQYRIVAGVRVRGQRLSV